MRKLALASAALLVAAILFAVLRPGPAESGRSGAFEREPATAERLSQRRGALVDQVVFTQESDAGRATALIEADRYDAYTQGLTSTTLYRRIRDAPGTAYDLSYGTSAELTLNPAGPELADGSLNPFHDAEIREAMNRLVDRQYIAEEIYGGLAEPRYFPISTAFPDYARLADVARELELRYGHDPEAARATIRERMRAMGAEMTGGRWHYEGEPVRLTFLIRTEDQRKRVGDYVANLLADTGFAVERRYQTAQQASRIWIASDPKAGRWHLYTGGWISTVIQRDQAQNFSNYYTPRGRAEPLWQAYDPPEAFDELAERLERRDYESWAERQEMMARALELAMESSYRVWLVDQLNVSAYGSDVKVATDLAGGLSGSALWPYTLRFEDRIGGEMVFGTPNLLTEPWNPIAGSNWIFDQMIITALQDQALMPDPFTGLYRPQRIDSAEVTVAEGAAVSATLDWVAVGTAERIEVPEDAWIDWNAENERMVTVGEKHQDGLTARTRTRIRYEDGYLDRRWHDGSRVSLADLVLPWIVDFARAKEASPLYDPAHLPNFKAYQRHFRGWRIVSRKPLVVEVYSDQIYPDAETVVAARAPVALPWHTLGLGIFGERSGELAFSSDKADRNEVTWLSMVAGPSLPVLARHLERARKTSRVPYPDVLGAFMREGEAEKRYAALADWRERRGHFWVSDGPFYLHSVHPVAGSLVLRRYGDFPDPADEWLRFTEPKIPELTLDGPMIVRGDRTAEFELGVTYRGEPYPDEAVEKVRYLLFGAGGELIDKGKARPAGEASYRVTLDPETIAELGSGANRLELALTSRRVALPAFASHVFATVPEGDEGAKP